MAATVQDMLQMRDLRSYGLEGPREEFSGLRTGVKHIRNMTIWITAPRMSKDLGILDINSRKKGVCA